VKWAKVVLIFGVSVGLTGCLMTREQIRESASSGRKEERSQISEAQIKKAEQAAQIDGFEENMRSLRGRVEVLENNWNQISEKNQNQENANKASAEANAKLMAFEEALRTLETQIQALTAEVNQLKSKRTASSSAPIRENKGNYAGADEAFNKKDWKRAIVGFQKYRDMNPSGKWYADATYKIGVSFQELNMQSEAKSFFEEVIAKYPKGKLSQKAQYRLKQLK